MLTELIEGAPTQSLAYFADRQVSGQWRAFVTALASTFYTNVDPDDADTFLREVGVAMARSLPLPKVATLEELEAAMNARWSDLDWGWVRLREGAGDVEILHGARPAQITGDLSGDWTRASAPVLEGIYSEWFLSQEGPDHLTVTVTGERAEPLTLRYGR